MSQTPILSSGVPNGTGSSVRTDMNAAFAALATLNSGTAFPSSPQAGWLCLRSDVGALYIRNDSNTQWVVWFKYSASSAPGASDDSAAGFRRGSFVFGQGLSDVYVCIDDTAGAAVWSGIAGGGGGGSSNLSTDANNTLTADPLLWSGTQASYDAIGTKDPNTIYHIEE